jgi:hypothetical protein
MKAYLSDPAFWNLPMPGDRVPTLNLNMELEINDSALHNCFSAGIEE